MHETTKYNRHNIRNILKQIYWINNEIGNIVVKVNTFKLLYII